MYRKIRPKYFDEVKNKWILEIEMPNNYIQVVEFENKQSLANYRKMLREFKRFTNAKQKMDARSH
ncbi:MAG: hypothetical protein J6T57_04590 [Alphaproteobacteria bacterium]|nr:hypothetical protein [Alphaproteobacteria bacterium]